MGKYLAFVVIGAVAAAIATVVVMKSLGFEGAGVTGGGMAGGVAGALAAGFASKKKSAPRR